jgi:peroxiredoxin
MTKEDLRTQYTTQNYVVQPVAEWRLVSTTAGVQKFDVAYIAPDDIIVRTAYILVNEADGEVIRYSVPSEVTPTASFSDRLRTYLRTLEVGSVFAISVNEMFEADAVAVVNAYFTVVDKVEKKMFVVKERNSTFTYQEMV